MKGLKKALKNFSQMFEDEKEPEIQIGFPTDVKHVAHIGWDGPAAVESPSWMKEFNGSGGFQSAPLGPTGAPVENPQVKWVSEDSKSRKKVVPELPKSSRRHSSTENSLSAESPNRETSSSKMRHSRKHQSKDSTESLKGSLESEPRPDIPKKSKRKKSKESIGNVGGSSSRSSSRSKGNPSSKSNDGLSQTNNMDSLVQEEEKETSGVS